MNKREWKNVLALLGSLSGEHKDALIGGILLAVFQGARPFVAVLLTGGLVDAVYEGEDPEVLFRMGAVGVTGIFLMALAEAFLVMLFNRKLEYMQEIQALPLNKKSMVMDFEYLEDVKIHEMRQRVEKYGGWSMSAMMLSCLNKMITALTTVVMAVCVVCPMFVGSHRGVSQGFVGSWLMTVLFLAVVLLAVWIEFKLGYYFNKKVVETRKTMSGYETRKKYYLDILSGYEHQKDLRICGQQKLYEAEIEDTTSQIKKVADKMVHFSVLDIFGQQTLSAATGFLVYVFASLLAFIGIISIGRVVTYSASILKFTEAIGQLAFLVSRLKAMAVNAQDYVDYMALPQHKQESTIPLEKRKDGKFSVEFEHVSFRYPGRENYAIRDLNLKFEIGEKMAIVGRNGSGKTTFIKLLCRLYDVTEGCIKVNGIDIRKYDYAEYCNLFAVVFQDFQVFSFPLGENVAAGFEVDPDRAVDALERAGMGSRYQSLPDRLSTSVGKEFEENGVTFSGGEKQKIAIARAIYKDAPFVIMDEPTAALDPESECEVYAGFDKMVGNKTALYISHRLASCRFCQDILVFDQGTVVQRGSHEELEKQEGLYRELWNAQAQYYT